MWIPFLMLIQSLAGPANSQRQMAITVDDLPAGPVSWLTTAERQALTESLLLTFERHQVPAIGFVNEGKLKIDGAVDPEQVALLERWLDAGHELGNHGYRHLDLHRVPVKQWNEDARRGEQVLRPLLAERGLEPRYFRHPFLRTGRSLEIKQESEAYLARLGYRVAPVTIDNQEWIFGREYHRVRGDADKRRRIGEAYVRYMLDVVRYYEQQTLAIVGEPIPHVLLLHTYELNADWLGQLLDRLAERGYEFISLEQALRHPAYESKDEYIGAGGITWLHRWALTRGMPGSTFAGEPELPTWLRN